MHRKLLRGTKACQLQVDLIPIPDYSVDTCINARLIILVSLPFAADKVGNVSPVSAEQSNI